MPWYEVSIISSPCSNRKYQPSSTPDPICPFSKLSVVRPLCPAGRRISGSPRLSGPLHPKTQHLIHPESLRKKRNRRGNCFCLSRDSSCCLPRPRACASRCSELFPLPPACKKELRRGVVDSSKQPEAMTVLYGIGVDPQRPRWRRRRRYIIGVLRPLDVVECTALARRRRLFEAIE